MRCTSWKPGWKCWLNHHLCDLSCPRPPASLHSFALLFCLATPLPYPALPSVDCTRTRACRPTATTLHSCASRLPSSLASTTLLSIKRSKHRGGWALNEIPPATDAARQDCLSGDSPARQRRWLRRNASLTSSQITLPPRKGSHRASVAHSCVLVLFSHTFFLPSSLRLLV